jgi:ubiquinone/menaquinone biosynthesis C-methylase UbiE
MENYKIKEVIDCYNLVANEYSEKFSDELAGKPFDRDFLIRFKDTFDNNSKVIDMGTGSGHIAQYLFNLGMSNIVGTDIAEKILEVARINYPHIKFENRNMFDTKYEDNSIDGIVCFYGIVHFTYKEIDKTIKEWKRILKTGGKAIFSFHIGNDNSVREEKFLDKENAKATWNFFQVNKVIEILEKNKIQYDDVLVRYPYINKEHPSHRCYIQFTKGQV